jgi:NTP pyrophosphatase (non-canonical NTP hydrolase)
MSEPRPIPPFAEGPCFNAFAYAQGIDEDDAYTKGLRAHLANQLKRIQDLCFGQAVNCGWHHNPVTGEWETHDFGSRIALLHSEASEAFEAYRKNKPDDHLPHRPGKEVELADLLIRVLDLAGEYQLDVIGAMFEKLDYNRHRPDHKPENRVKEGGKIC